MYNLKGAFARILTHPISGAFIASLAVVAGGLASLYAELIKNSFPLYRPTSVFNQSEYGTFCMEAFLFWLSLLLFLFLSALRQYLKDKYLIQQQKSLIKIFRTLPPQNFLYLYEQLFKSLTDSVAQLDALFEFDEKQDDLVKSAFTNVIGQTINACVTLAKIWDQPHNYLEKDIIYEANIMIYYDVHSLPQWVEDNIKKDNTFFVEKNYESICSSIDGVLVSELKKQESTDAPVELRKSLNDTPLVLPVTFEKDENKRYQNLHGAPQALVENKVQLIPEVNTIVDKCKQNHDYDQSTINKIQSYYEKEHHAQSIVSIPLTADKTLLGVLNIYRNQPMILTEEKMAKQFGLLISPFCYFLGKMVSTYLYYNDK